MVVGVGFGEEGGQEFGEGEGRFGVCGRGWGVSFCGVCLWREVRGGGAYRVRIGWS